MKALIRCDATAEIGSGHLSRCIALAEALQLFSVRCSFAGQFDGAAFGQIDLAGFECVRLSEPVNSRSAEQELASIVALHAADFIVIDSYRADDRYLSDLKSQGQSAVVIDDFRKLKIYDCDVILNFTWEAPTLDYPQGPALLLGPDYLLVRRKLVDARAESLARRREGPIQNLLVAIGGSDPKGITGRIVRLIDELNTEACVRAIAQPDDALEEALSRFAPGSGIVPRQPDLSEQFQWADAAITGGGLIKYECAYMGIPAASIAQNEGQDGETKVFSRAGLVFDLGLADCTSDKALAGTMNSFIENTGLRAKLAERMRETFISDPTVHAARKILEAIRL
ncbi:UDP-2,4-diacetamido-2,4,6-trideoxy-beta-L-altropyranose hydrolase [Erythrobacter sp. THAF29]|uniref:UDP-2,4-diacetamido-2,4, 6-trideoxy-beta-L-altropyranose hydrolase n=1 Tax=Erythrobacter sp. THAF29 TaxID=2587851 RepID=UPI0012A845C1|nr:UDP-2,4-diacetamido-2,4,6-trideoxy-beta-L-altropyranose hydrolase [Erythrobacter sp. THAF29]QFT77191.1 UDP-2,4-diacetamido-2,4,6-trideoxy-beta-L-altropyranose hydrolase [Erythrobacter sp. THAF29]